MNLHSTVANHSHLSYKWSNEGHFRKKWKSNGGQIEVKHQLPEHETVDFVFFCERVNNFIRQLTEILSKLVNILDRVDRNSSPRGNFETSAPDHLKVGSKFIFPNDCRKSG